MPPTLDRMCTQIRGTAIDTWTAEHVAFWGTAVEGSPALKATLIREFYHEYAVHEGYMSVAPHWGPAQFFDA
eukprot:4741990-Pyramimonas_sp.AAC.1